MRSVLFCTPCYGGMHPRHAASVRVAQDRWRDQGLRVTVADAVGDSFVARARKQLAHVFLKTDATHLFFVDADVEFPAEGLEQLLATGYDVVGATYAFKELLDERRLKTARQAGGCRTCACAVTSGAWAKSSVSDTVEPAASGPLRSISIR